VRWASYGENPKRRGFWRGLGYYVLALIPIIGWIVFYLAGKGIARKVGEGGAKDMVAVLAALTAVAMLGVLCLLSGALPPAMSLAAMPTDEPPLGYSTPTMPYPTRTPRPTFLGTAASMPGCMSWDQVTRGFVGRRVCVTGLIAQRNEVCDEQMLCSFTYRFTKTNPSAFLFTTDYWYTSIVVIGKCVNVSGIVKMNGQTIYMNNPEISYC
jgi:hypothetical protein